MHPENQSLAILKKLVANLGDELAGYRKRAITAEAKLKSIEENVEGSGMNVDQTLELQRENVELKARLDDATQRTNVLLSKIRFLRQQSEREEEAK